MYSFAQSKPKLLLVRVQSYVRPLHRAKRLSANWPWQARSQVAWMPFTWFRTKALADQKFADFTKKFAGGQWTNVTIGIEYRRS